MPDSNRRRALGGLIAGTRLVGVAIILIAVLSLPEMGFLTGRLSQIFGLLGSLVLLLIGVLWLFAVTLFVRFFDQYLSRN